MINSIKNKQYFANRLTNYLYIAYCTKIDGHIYPRTGLCTDSSYTLRDSGIVDTSVAVVISYNEIQRILIDKSVNVLVYFCTGEVSSLVTHFGFARAFYFIYFKNSYPIQTLSVRNRTSK